MIDKATERAARLSRLVALFCYKWARQDGADLHESPYILSEADDRWWRRESPDAAETHHELTDRDRREHWGNSVGNDPRRTQSYTKASK